MLLGDERGDFVAMGLSPANQLVQNHCSASLDAPVLLFLFLPSLLLLHCEWSEKWFLCLTKILSLLLPLTPSLASSPQDP